MAPVEVALAGKGDAVPALIEDPFAAALVGDTLAWVMVVHFLSFPRPEQVTFGSLAVQADALVDETLHELEVALLSAAGAAA